MHGRAQSLHVSLCDAAHSGVGSVLDEIVRVDALDLVRGHRGDGDTIVNHELGHHVTIDENDLAADP